MSNYQEYLVTTFRNPGEPSSSKIRVRPLTGQGLPKDMRVECSQDMRKNHPVGTIFLIEATLKSKEGGKPFLYSSYNWSHKIVTREEADEFISENYNA